MVLVFWGGFIWEMGDVLPLPPTDPPAGSSEMGAGVSGFEMVLFLVFWRRRYQMMMMTMAMMTAPPATPPAMAPTGVDESEDGELVADADALDVEEGPPVGEYALASTGLLGRCAPLRLERGQPMPPSALQAFSLQHPRNGGLVPVQV